MRVVGGFFENIGKAAVEKASAAKSAFSFIGESALAFVCVLRHPFSLRLKDTALAFQRAACQALPIAVMIGFLLGLILAFESAASMKQFGVEIYVADLIAIGLFRELGPLVTAILLAGRSASAFAAEIGTMAVNEELDALATMNLDPVRFLAVPRILAAILAMPLLTIAAELAGLFGGMLVLQVMGVPPVAYYLHVSDATSVFTIVLGLGKSAIFGLLVGMIGCACGIRTRKTADGVGVSATSAVVGSIVAVAVADGLIAVVCYILDV